MAYFRLLVEFNNLYKTHKQVIMQSGFVLIHTVLRLVFKVCELHCVTVNISSVNDISRYINFLNVIQLLPLCFISIGSSNVVMTMFPVQNLPRQCSQYRTCHNNVTSIKLTMQWFTTNVNNINQLNQYIKDVQQILNVFNATLYKFKHAITQIIHKFCIISEQPCTLNN